MMKKLMEKCRMIRENQKKNGTKGFSMVELIIVIAIMAILIALIGTQLIPYLEKSRKTRDLDTLNAVLTAVQSITTDHELDPTNAEDLAKIYSDSGYQEEFNTYLGYDWDNITTKLTSKAATKDGATASITAVKVDGSDAIMVKCGDLFVTSAGKTSNNATIAENGTIS